MAYLDETVEDYKPLKIKTGEYFEYYRKLSDGVVVHGIFKALEEAVNDSNSLGVISGRFIYPLKNLNLKNSSKLNLFTFNIVRKINPEKYPEYFI